MCTSHEYKNIKYLYSISTSYGVIEHVEHVGCYQPISGISKFGALTKVIVYPSIVLYIHCIKYPVFCFTDFYRIESMSETKINKLIESYNHQKLLSFPISALILIDCCLGRVISCMIVTWLSYMMLLSG